MLEVIQWQRLQVLAALHAEQTTRPLLVAAWASQAALTAVSPEHPQGFHRIRSKIAGSCVRNLLLETSCSSAHFVL